MHPITLPAAPSGSLYGSFPAFPTTNFGWNYHIPWPINYTIGFNLTVPNFGGIMEWIIHIFEWFIGWGAAYYSYGLQYAADTIANTFIYVISAIMGIFDSLISTVQYIGQTTGIWGIPIEMALIGIIMLGMVLLGMGIVKAGQAISELMRTAHAGGFMLNI